MKVSVAGSRTIRSEMGHSTVLYIGKSLPGTTAMIVEVRIQQITFSRSEAGVSVLCIFSGV